MPKPKLPDEKRKDVFLQVRFTGLEKALILARAKKRKCKTITEYIRKLVSEDKRL